MIDWGHVWEMGVTALSGSVPILLYMRNNKRKARDDAERRDKEHQAILNGLMTERKYFPSHAHGEKAGPLEAEGINYPPE